MKNNIFLVIAFIVVVALFFVVTNDTNEVDKSSEIAQPLTTAVPEKNNTLNQQVSSENKSLDDILPNSDQLKDSEILEEAELMLTMSSSQQVNDGLTILTILSDRNNSRANYLLAELYGKGLLVDQDEEKAQSYYERAALNGSDDANIYLFNYYLDSENVSLEHFKQAREWFVTATAEQVNPIADYALAHIYEKGLGIDIDLEQAKSYYQQAAKENFPLAYEKLGDIYVVSGDKDQIIEALFLFQRAANEDIPSAQYKLGYMYEDGLATKQDYETARFWYQRAANNNFIRAHVALGLLYENGLGVEKNNLKAYDHYRFAAEAGDTIAQNSVARSFERGIGVDKDLERAIFWYEKSADQQDGNAAYNLGRIYEEYDSVRDIALAKKWYERAVQANISEAQNALNRLDK